MSKLPPNLTGDSDYDREFRRASQLTTISISVLDESEALELIAEWGETLPYSGYQGYFRFVVQTRQEGLAYRSMSPFMNTLAEAASYVSDFPEKLTNPDYDNIVGLDIVYFKPSKRVSKPITKIPSSPKRKDIERKLIKQKIAKTQPRDAKGRFIKPAWKKQPRYKNGRFKKRKK